MNIDNKLINRLAKLSNLEIDESKKESLAKELNEIVGFVENLNEIDVSNIEANFTTLEGGTPFREDIPQNNEEFSKAVLKNAPKSEENCFIVPKIIS
jgi:aspartyl-tRNA(Asn)/glutamyl-tRNA(Gln) amidotransferase subunit C